MDSFRSEVLVVGAGPAGLSAALAASKKKARVTVIDDNPYVGGQIWRAELGKTRFPQTSRLLERLSDQRIRMINSGQVFAAEDRRRLLAVIPEGPLKIEFQNLIIATGARERFLPFPGWTLPGVYGAGGLQAMVKGGLNIENKRVVVAGTGPLLLAVADYLVSKSARIVAIVEQASRDRINRFAVGLWRSPSKIAQAVKLRSRLRGIPYLTDSWITSARGDGEINRLSLNRKGRTWNLECDLLACGFHLVPNLELALILGCETRAGAVSVGEFQETSVQDIFCAGEATGIGGVEASLLEGEIAGLAATDQTSDAGKLFAARDKTRRFADALNKAFELRRELKTLSDDKTIVCRCEDVEYARLTEFSSFRDAKLMTRCGMGPCQGRICGPAAQFLFGWEAPAVRPPIFPVKMEDL